MPKSTASPHGSPSWFNGENALSDGLIAEDDIPVSLVLNGRGAQDVWDGSCNGLGVVRRECDNRPVGLRREYLHGATRPNHDHVESVSGYQFQNVVARTLANSHDGCQCADADRDGDHHQ